MAFNDFRDAARYIDPNLNALTGKSKKPVTPAIEDISSPTFAGMPSVQNSTLGGIGEKVNVRQLAGDGEGSKPPAPLNNAWQKTLATQFPNGVPPIAAPATPTIQSMQPAPGTPEDAQYQVDRKAFAATSAPVVASAVPSPAVPPITDPNGFAVVGGKKINYADIGAQGKDPLYGQGGFVAVNTPSIADAEAKADFARRKGIFDAGGEDRYAVQQRLGYVPNDYNDNKALYDAAMLKTANDANKVQGDIANQQGQLAIEAPYKKGLIEAEKMKAEGAGTLNTAHANALNAEASFKTATSSPWYLARQERIAAIKDKTDQQKEQDKLDHEVLKNWLKGTIGSDPTPQEINTGSTYMKQLDTFNRGFDAFVEKLPAQNRQFWVQGFNAKDPSVMAELAKRGLVKPVEPVFTPRTAGVLPENK